MLHLSAERQHKNGNLLSIWNFNHNKPFCTFVEQFFIFKLLKHIFANHCTFGQNPQSACNRFIGWWTNKIRCWIAVLACHGLLSQYQLLIESNIILVSEFKLHFDVPNMIISLASLILTFGISFKLLYQAKRIGETTIEEHGLSLKSMFYQFPWAI